MNCRSFSSFAICVTVLGQSQILLGDAKLKTVAPPVPREGESPTPFDPRDIPLRQHENTSISGPISRILYNKRGEPDAVILGNGNCDGEQVHLGREAGRYLASLMSQNPKGNLTVSGETQGNFTHALSAQYEGTSLYPPRSREAWGRKSRRGRK